MDYHHEICAVFRMLRRAHLPETHALQLTLVGRSGVPPPRWFFTLQLLLAKTKGLCLASNNRILNLYEGDFNFYKGDVIGVKAMEALIFNQKTVKLGDGTLTTR